MTTHADAERERRRLMEEAALIYLTCTCLWPLVKYRNGDGHNDDCPAHHPLGSRRD